MPETSRLRDQPAVAFVSTSQSVCARAFYGVVLGLPLVSEELPFALVFDAHGTLLRVTVVETVTPAGYTVLGWQVTDAAAGVRALRQAGVRFAVDEGMGQDELGVWSSSLSISQHA